MNKMKDDKSGANEILRVRRAWRDWQIGEVAWRDISDLHWDWTSGGVRIPCPQPFVMGYVSCDKVRGEIAHSCRHGEGPHRIKVTLVKKDQDKETWAKILEVVGPKP
jgi:hypothetical protein